MPELARTYKGAEEVASFWRQWLEAWGEQDYEDPDVIDADDRIVLWITSHRLRGKGSGAEVAMRPYAWVLGLRDGKVVRGTIYMDKGEAL